MNSKKQSINLICVFLILAVLLSAALIAAFAIFKDDGITGSPKNPSTSGRSPQYTSPSLSYDDFGGLLNLNGALGLSPLLPLEGSINVYSVKSTESQKTYFKIKSFGNYNGTNTWEEAEEYIGKINDSHSASYLPAYLFENKFSEPSSVLITPHFDQYILPYYPSIVGNTNIQTSDVICTGNKSNTYTVYFYTEDAVDNILTKATLSNEYENDYRNFVYSKYVDVDAATLDYMNGIIFEYGFSKKDPQIIEKVAQYIKGSAKYDLQYDRNLDSEENVAISFLETYKTGICQHYATAATLLYRALGIPARYTIGFATETVADEWVNIRSQEAHAWVEVYIDGVGWKYVEVTGGTESSDPPETPEITTPIKPPDTTSPPPDTTQPPETSQPPDTTQPPETSQPPLPQIIISPVKAEKKYNGEALEAINAINGFSEYEARGYTYDVTVSGERTEPGKTASTIEQITIFDPNGHDVTQNFEIIKQHGIIHVYLSELTFVSADAVKVYDGKILSNHSVAFDEPSDEYYYSYEAYFYDFQTDVGSRNNSFDVIIRNKFGEDITDIYKIVRTYGKLTVIPAEITLIADNATKKYDGTALTCSSFTVEGELADGDEIISCSVIGSQTAIGRSENIIDPNSIVIKHKSGVDVVSNYVIKLIAGTLTVTP